MSMKPEEKKLREELIGAEDTATFQRNYLVEAGAGAGKTYTCLLYTSRRFGPSCSHRPPSAQRASTCTGTREMLSIGAFPPVRWIVSSGRGVCFATIAMLSG